MIVTVYPRSLKPAQYPGPQVEVVVAVTTTTTFPFWSVVMYRVGAVKVAKVPDGKPLRPEVAENQNQAGPLA